MSSTAHRPVGSRNRERTSWVDRLVMVVEGGSYLFAAGLAINWLVKKFMGRDVPTDDIEQAGLWVLAGLAALSVAFLVRRAASRRADEP